LTFSHDQYAALQDGAGLLDRRSRGRLELTGADRRSYLQGLLTNDIDALLPGTGCYAALLTPQGRMISDMRVSELGDRVLMDLPGATAEFVRQRLADFIFSEDVEVRDLSRELGHYGLYGPMAAERLAAALDTADDETFRAATREQLSSMETGANREYRFGTSPLAVVSSDDYGIPGFELFLDTAAIDSLAGALRAAGARDVDVAAVLITRIEAGRPEFGVDMDEHTIPLEAGIEDRAISQSKGCYVGQEVIIRVLHRGQGRVAKRLVGMIGAAGDGPLTRGMPLEADGKPVGTITSAAESPRLHRPIALGYVHRDVAEPGRIVHAPSGSGARSLTVVTTPFVPTASE